MSDEPVPPPLPHAPPPPPFAPPGYAAYQSSNWGAGLSRVKPLTLWITILLGVVVLGSVISFFTIGPVVDGARDYLDTGDRDAFDDRIGLTFLTGALTGLPGLGLIVLSMIWLFRIVRNHQHLGRSLQWSPGWAIGGWFAPPCVYVIPALMLQESWKAADPAEPPGSTSWKNAGPPTIVWLWFVVYSLVGTIGIFAFNVGQSFSSDRDDLADFYDDRASMLYVQPVITLAGCVVWFLVVRGLTQRHTELTGEASAR